jgi:hypothetical protein
VAGPWFGAERREQKGPGLCPLSGSNPAGLPDIHRFKLLPAGIQLADSARTAIYVNVLTKSAAPAAKMYRRTGRCLMDEVKSYPLGEEIDRLHAEHHRYAQRLEELLQKPYLTEDEQLEEVRLKKLKLHAKDLIFALERRMAPAVA